MVFWYVKMFYHQGLSCVILMLNSTLLPGNFHWKIWMISRVKDLLHMTEKLNQLQKSGAFLEHLFFTFTCKCLRLICPDLYLSRCLTWVFCYDNKETYCSQWDTRVHHMNPVSWSRTKKKKSMALFIKNLEHVQLIGVPWGKICDSHKTCAISPYDKTSHNQ